MGGQDVDSFMADLLNDIDSSPIPSSSASRAKTSGTTRIKSSRDAPKAPPLALARSSQHHASLSSGTSHQAQQSFAPGKLSLGQISKLAFSKPGSSNPGGPTRAAPTHASRPAGPTTGAFVKGSNQISTPAPHQSWSSSTSSASSRLPPAAQRPKETRPAPSPQSVAGRTFAHAKSDSQIPFASGSSSKVQSSSTATKQLPSRNAPSTFVDDDSFASIGDDDAWMADVEEAALAGPVAVVKKEEEESIGTKASNPAPDGSDSMVKRVSRTQSKLWAQRAKTSQLSRSVHRSYIRCRILDVRESTYDHPLPNSSRTVERPQKIIFCVEKPRRGAQYREDEALEGELPLATWDGRAEAARHRKIVLREEWTATRVSAGNYIHCIGHWADEGMDEEDERVERECYQAQLVADEQREQWMRDRTAPQPLPQVASKVTEEVKASASPPLPPSSFDSDADLFASLDEDLLKDDENFEACRSRPQRTIPTMHLLSSSPLSDSPHADNLLILHPDILVTATSVCDVPTCVRKPLVRGRISGTGAVDKMSEALVMGCMLHEVLQACLTGQGLLDDTLVPDFDETSLQPFFDMPFPLHWYGPGRTNFSLPFLVKQVKLQVLHNLDGLLCCGMETSAAEAKLLDLCRPFGEFSKRYLEDTLAVTRAENGNSADALQGLFRGVNGMLETASAFKEDATVLDSRTTVPTLARVTHVFDVEEEIWSPMYGLKGKMDVSVEVELQETEVERPAWRGGNHFVPGQQQRAGTGPSAQQPPQRGAQGGSFYRRTQSTPTTGPVRRSAMNRYSSIMPMEIKTGRSVDALEHRAQTMLYTLMMSDRYGTNVDSGLLYYTRSGDMHRVRRTRNEVRGLIVGRNELAFWMKRDSKDEEEIGDQRRIAQARANGGDATQELQEADEGNTALPSTIDNERECNRCFVQDGCMLYRRTIDRIVEDEENPSEISELYSRITSHLTSSQAAFYQKWERLLSLEEEDMVKFKRELWTLTAAAREEVGRCFANMIMEPRQPDIGAGTSSGEVHSHTYRFVRKPMAGSPGQMLLGGSISAGDPCVISIEPGMFSVAQGYIVEVSSHFVTIGIDHHLDAILERAAVEQGKDPGDVSNLDITFRIDRDEYSDGMAKIRFQLSRLFFSTSERDHRHRELIVDLEAPRFDDTVQLRDEDIPSHLNEDQRAAMRRVLAAEDYSLILGMPGTGKTTTIAELIKLLVARGKTILLASYTHSAVDTILRKLLDAPEVRLLRLGNVDRVHDDLQGHTLPKVSSVEELDLVLNTPNVIATTCLSTGHATFARRKFDYCIVDEASQITLPTCLGPLRFADKFVLVGDHFQLPPLVRNTTARSGGLDISLFKRLSDAHNEAVVYLTRQYRMNETIMMLSNHLIYDGLLKCGNEEVAKQVLHLPHHERAIALLHAKAATSSQKSHSSSVGSAAPPPCKVAAGADGRQQHCWLEQLLDPSCTAVFVDTDDVPGTETRRGRMVQNNVEAGVIQQLARSLVLGGVPAGDIAVITPYRQQLKLLQNLLLPPRLAQAVTTSRQSAAAIKREMEREGGAGAGGEIEILTADRSQGRDKPVVLISLVRSNDLGARGVGELLNDWRRINVALTRAQRKVVIVGSQKTLSAAPLLEDFFGLMREQGCIQKLPKGALEMHPIASTEPGREIPPALSQEVDRKVQESKKSALVKDEELDDGLFSRPAARGFVSTSPHSSQEKQHSGRPLEELQPLSQSSQNGNKVTDYKADDDSIDEIEADWGPVPSRVLGKRKERSLNGSQQQRLSEEDKEQRPPSPDRSQELAKNLVSSSKPALQDGAARRQAAAKAKGEALMKSRPIIRDAILASQED